MLGPNFRVVNKGDIVPHVPTEPYYCHVGSRIVLHNDIVDPESSGWVEERLAAFRRMLDQVIEHLDIIDNHKPQTRITRVIFRNSFERWPRECKRAGSEFEFT